jgi:hypothetical protein
VCVIVVFPFISYNIPWNSVLQCSFSAFQLFLDTVFLRQTFLLGAQILGIDNRPNSNRICNSYQLRSL